MPLQNDEEAITKEETKTRIPDQPKVRIKEFYFYIAR